MAKRARPKNRGILAELHESAHDLVNDLAAIRMCAELASATASKNQVDPLLASIQNDLEQIRLATEEANNRARLLTRRLQEALDDEEMLV